jgi:hypothetical protein
MGYAVALKILQEILITNVVEKPNLSSLKSFEIAFKAAIITLHTKQVRCLKEGISAEVVYENELPQRHLVHFNCQ